MDAEIEIIESHERKVRSIFMGTFFTLLVLLIGVLYGMMWGILFVTWVSKAVYHPSCLTLISWDKALYVVQFICAGLHLVSTIMQLVSTSYDKDSNIPKYIMGCRSCFSFTAGATILVGITFTYFTNENLDLCGDLKTINLAYIITECTLISFCCLCVCVFCSLSLCVKKNRKIKDEN
jgi:hypothetical protein